MIPTVYQGTNFGITVNFYAVTEFEFEEIEAAVLTVKNHCQTITKFLPDMIVDNVGKTITYLLTQEESLKIDPSQKTRFEMDVVAKGIRYRVATVNADSDGTLFKGVLR